MFPDAVTVRGKRHVEELAALSPGNRTGAIVFLVFAPRPKFFLPDYHTDLEFARALVKARNKVEVIPAAVQINPDLSIGRRVQILDIPWSLIEEEARDCGSYIFILRVHEDVSVDIGRMGRRRFRPGFYLYVGSAEKNLSRRIARHRRIRKKNFWHIDYLRGAADFHCALPIRTSDHLECEIARAVELIADWKIPGFGSSDCSCPAHLFGMKEDPLKSSRFISLLQFFRMDRLEERLLPQRSQSIE